ncbi:SpoIIE family protein phosphatase [uncultured Ruthenibacterium sp.]|uniref:SpoIIE family protein phosphatase n=1 Tax=uncultured Ruthenibacterium sp. TaxID=1905347 RepID=UPI00349EBD2E
MSVKTREAPRLQPVLNTVRRFPMIWQIAAAMGAFVAARAPIFGELLPLGLCVTAGMPPSYVLCAGVGAVLGYALLLSIPQTSAYLGAVVAVVLLKLIGGDERYRDIPMVPVCAGGICYCLLRAGFSAAAGQGLTGILAGAAESLLILGLGYFMTVFFVHPLRILRQNDTESRAAVCFALIVLIACLAPYRIFEISFSHILGALVTLAAAWRGGSAWAALCGTATAVSLVAAGDELYVGFAISAAGLAAGLFSTQGRRLTALTFCTTGFLGVWCAPDASSGFCFMAELCAASLVFTLIPQNWIESISSTTNTQTSRAACATLSGRLTAFANALHNVGSTVQQVCEKLPPKQESYADLCARVADRCCQDCERCTDCWITHSSDTYDCFNKLEPLVFSEQGVTAADLPSPLSSYCIAPGKLAAALNREAIAQATRRGLYTRSGTTRAALCEQYGAMACALGDLAGQVAMEELPDRRKARRVEQLFEDIGLAPLDVSVAEDGEGRLHTAVTLSSIEFDQNELYTLTREVSELCHRKFSRAVCTQNGASTLLVFRERPRFAARFGVCSLPADGKVSADATQVLERVPGRAHAVLCDGMGTGKSAAVDGVMAARLAGQLLGAGFGQAETARLVNVALTLKSDDESATTFDAVTIDLYTGAARLFKAGAVPSFLIHGDRASAYGETSVPIGILKKVLSSESELMLSDGDCLVLMSDGALAGGMAWMNSQLVLHSADTPQVLADAVAHAAREKSDRPDDITVMAIRLYEV